MHNPLPIPLPLLNEESNLYRREGSQARSTAPGSGPGLAGVLGFESHPSHIMALINRKFLLKFFTGLGLFAIIVLLAYCILIFITSMTQKSLDKEVVLALFSGIISSMCFYALTKLTPFFEEQF
jgi:hypothetical protein